jgi:hypothetical protein
MLFTGRKSDSCYSRDKLTCCLAVEWLWMQEPNFYPTGFFLSLWNKRIGALVHAMGYGRAVSEHKKGRYTHNMPGPCRYPTTKGLECVFSIWFTQHGSVWFTLAVPPPCHPRPCRSVLLKATAQYRRPVCYLSAFGFFRLPCRVPRRLLSDAYQSQMQVTSVKPNTVCHGRGKEW